LCSFGQELALVLFACAHKRIGRPGPSSSPLPLTTTMASHSHPSSTANLVGVHYRVGKKIGEGSFGVIFEGQNRRSGSCGLNCIYGRLSRILRFSVFSTGTNLLNSQTVAIKFVRSTLSLPSICPDLSFTTFYRNQGKLKRLNFVMNVARIVY